MAFFSSAGNLKGFALSRPPLVVFTLCLMAFALTTLSLAYFIKETEFVKDPDVRLDWNTLLELISREELCVTPSNSTVEGGAGGESEGGNNASVSVMLGLAQELGEMHNNTLISGTFPATMFGLSETAHGLSVSFHVSVNLSAHLPGSVCATFSGPRLLLPSSRPPPACSTHHQAAAPSVTSARFTARAQGPQMVDDWCSHGSVLRLLYHSNPDLTAMLTLHDRSIVNLHLMHTSYFLLVMAMTLVCYALIKGKPKPKQCVEKVPLDP